MKIEFKRAAHYICNLFGFIIFAVTISLIGFYLLIYSNAPVIEIGASGFGVVAILAGLAFAYCGDLKDNKKRRVDYTEMRGAAEQLCLSGILFLLVLVITFAGLICGNFDLIDNCPAWVISTTAAASVPLKWLSVSIFAIASLVGVSALHSFSLVLGKNGFNEL